MIQIDLQKIDEATFAAKVKEISSLAPFRQPEGKAYAICLKDAFDVIASVRYLREQEAAVLLFHADTPFETAKQMSESAGCSYLQYGRWNEVCELASTSSKASEPGLLQFSSGTTGKPKLIFRAWKDVEEEIRAYNKVLRLGPDEPSLIMVPVSHSFGLLTGVLAALERGAEAIIVPNKNPKFQLQMLRSTERSLVYGVPFLYHLLLSMGKEEIKFHKLVSSGAPLTDNLLTELQSRSTQVWQQYGCTEVGCISLGAQPSSSRDVGTVLPHLRVHIDPVSLPEYGEVIVQTSPGAVVQTRDMGFINPEGRLHIVGRLDDLINVGGLKVIPLEVESVIESMPGIKEAVVFRANHPVWGEAAKALITTDGAITASDVKTWCLSRLPSYKIPTFIESVPEIPRLPSGKISRKTLEERERMNNGQ